MKHLSAIKVIDYISGILLLLIGFLLVALFFLGAGIFGGIDNLKPDDRTMLALFFGSFGLFIGGAFIIFGILSIVAGNAIVNRQVWSQIYHIVIAILNVLNFPLGTAIAVYFLWVLLFNEESKSLFSGRGASASEAAYSPEEADSFKY